MITLIVGAGGAMTLARELGVRSGVIVDIDTDTPVEAKAIVLVGRKKGMDIFLVTQDPMGISIEMEQALLDMGFGLSKGIDRKITVRLSGKALEQIGESDETNRGDGQHDKYSASSSISGG